MRIFGAKTLRFIAGSNWDIYSGLRHRDCDYGLQDWDHVYGERDHGQRDCDHDHDDRDQCDSWITQTNLGLENVIG